MKKSLVVVLVVLAVIFVYRSCSDNAKEKSLLQESTMLIRQQIANVSKLIVTEGHFAEVYNYKDSKALFGALLSADKKALVVVNAEVTVAYDLSKVAFRLDEDNKVLHIEKIPEPEVKINPDFEYYDVTADYLNPFDAADYNKIKKTVNASLLKKIDASTLRSNARNRLLSELQKFYVLTSSLGWTLACEGDSVENMRQLHYFNAQ